MNIIVLAGGQSSRFAPLSNKNLLPFLGKSLLYRQLENLKDKLTADITVVANPEDYELTQTEVKDFSGVKVVAQEGSGQGAAIISALKDYSGDDSDLLVINSNDVFTDNLYKDFLAALPALRKNNHGLLTGYKVEKYFPGGYLVMNEKDHVVSVIEKPGEGNEPSDCVRLVFDYFPSLKELLNALNAGSSEKDDLYEVVLSDMMNSGKVFELLRYSDVWATLKFPWHVFDLMSYLLSTITEKKIHENAQISDKAIINGNVIIEEGVRVFPGAVINGPAYVGKNTIIGNNSLVRDSIVGDDCVIGFSSEVARSYLAGKVWLHMNYIGDSIIDRNVSFGSGALTANLRLDEGDITVNIKGEKTNSGRNKLGTIIGSDVRVGVGVKIMPGVKIGTNSVVGPGVVLNQDIDSDSFISIKQELVTKVNKLNINKINRDDFTAKLKK